MKYLLFSLCLALLTPYPLFENLLAWWEGPSAADRQLMQELQGAWRMKVPPSQGNTGWAQIKILEDGKFMFAVFDWKRREFYAAGGGRYEVNGGKYYEYIEFHTIDPVYVGTKAVFDCRVANGVWYHKGVVPNDQLDVYIDEQYVRIDHGNESPLAGNWTLIERNGRSIPGEASRTSRKLLKILSGTRFQWAEYDRATRTFYGCGGGTYMFNNGRYTENLEFLSQDSTQVGKNLTFNARLQGSRLTREGRNSRGQQVVETWVRN